MCNDWFENLLRNVELKPEEVELILMLEESVRKTLSKAEKQSTAHKLDHLLRVTKNALEIPKREAIDVDYFVLISACLLHDVDSPYDRKREHVELSARKAEKIMNELKFPKEKAEKVLKVIRQHSTETPVEITENEAKVLFDADKLDGVGAIGIARVFMSAGQRSMSIKEAIEWYKKKIEIAENMLQTETGKKMIKEKMDTVLNFLDRLERELSKYHQA